MSLHLNLINRGTEGELLMQGRLDSNTAPEAEKVVDELAARFEDLILNMKELDYISSAGLRVLMKARKRLDKAIPVINVSRDVYDIFETTGFTSLLDVKKAYRKVSVDGLKVIGKGFFGTVYRIDNESIVKVYSVDDSLPIIENEINMARKAFVNGIPTAIAYDIVKVGKDYGSVFELLNARTFNELVQEGQRPLDEIVAMYTDLMKQVHETELPVGTFPSYKDKFSEYLDEIKKDLTDEQYSKLKGMIDSVPDRNTVIHGDIQMKNVMLVDNEPMLIDMETLGLGNPIFEFAGLYVTYKSFSEDDHGNSMMFLGIPEDVCDAVWDKTFEGYFSFKEETARKETLDKIRLTASIRFLYLIESTDLKDNDLGKLRIKHTKEQIAKLLETVESLAL